MTNDQMDARLALANAMADQLSLALDTKMMARVDLILMHLWLSGFKVVMLDDDSAEQRRLKDRLGKTEDAAAEATAEISRAIWAQTQLADLATTIKIIHDVLGGA